MRTLGHRLGAAAIAAATVLYLVIETAGSRLP